MQHLMLLRVTIKALLYLDTAKTQGGTIIPLWCHSLFCISDCFLCSQTFMNILILSFYIYIFIFHFLLLLTEWLLILGFLYLNPS